MYLTEFDDLLDKHQLECAPIYDIHYHVVCLKGSSSYNSITKDRHVLIGKVKVIRCGKEEIDEFLKQVRLELLFS